MELKKIEKIRLGDYIVKSTVNNRKLIYGCDLIAGVSNDGIFTKPKVDVSSVDLKPYKIVKKGAFVYNPSRLDIGSIAYFEGDLCIVSHLYMIFYLNEKGKERIDPKYLFMYMRRREFQREVSFRNYGSQRPEFNFNKMSDIIIPLPDIEIQKKYSAIYESMIENQKSYETGLEDLKLICDGYIEDLRRKIPSTPIGPFIHCTDRKTDDVSLDIRGISNQQKLIPSESRTQGVEKEKYLRIDTREFGYSPIHINDGSIAFNNDNNSYLLSPIYKTFKINNENELFPEYLMMWFSRSEFTRYCWFYAFGSARDNFEWDQMCEVKIPIPNITVQKSIANLYKCYTERKEINEYLKDHINNMCPLLIKGALEEQEKKGGS